MAFIIQAEMKDVQEALNKTTLSIPSMNRKFLAVIGKKTAETVKTGIKQTYSPPSKYYKRTGALLRSWTFHAKKDGSQVSVFPRVIATNNNKNRQWAVGLSSILSYGTADGRIKPRAFIQRGENYASSGAYMQEVQKIVDKELEKYWGN